MNIVIEPVTNQHFNTLNELFYTMQTHLYAELNQYQSAKLLLNYLEAPDSICLGLFADDELVGFITGNALNEKTFYFSGLYVEKKYRYYVKRLMSAAENLIKLRSYKAWISESSSKQGNRVLSKFGGLPIEVKYMKEL